MEKLKLPLSVTIIAKNEEKNISRCIESLSFAGEIVVVDSFSQDRTVELAKSLGAQVYQEAWRGFGLQKALAAEKAQNDWVLSVDADEVISSELAEELRQKFSSLDPATGYWLPRKSFYLGRWIRYGGWYPDYQKKLFHRGHSQFDGSPIHETVKSAKEDYFQEPVLHYVFTSIADQVETNNRYSGLLAEKLFKQGQRFSLGRLIVKPFSKFLETYLWKRGFMDGLPGFVISVSAAYSVFLKWAKLWELERQKS